MLWPGAGLGIRPGRMGGNRQHRYQTTSTDTTSSRVCPLTPTFNYLRAAYPVPSQRPIHFGAACRNRTDDLLITSETLYRLS